PGPPAHVRSQGRLYSRDIAPAPSSIELIGKGPGVNTTDAAARRCGSSITAALVDGYSRQLRWRAIARSVGRCLVCFLALIRASAGRLAGYCRATVIPPRAVWLKDDPVSPPPRDPTGLGLPPSARLPVPLRV